MKKMKMAAALLFAAVLTACGGSEKKEAAAMKVAAETVSAHAGEGSSTYVGQVEEQSATTLSFTGSGAIRQMLVKEGQTVSRGQLVAVLDDTQARNALASAEATLRQAQDGYNRLKQVHDAGSLVEQKWVEVQSQLQQAKSMRDMAQKALADCRLTSPVSGVVGSVVLEAGETALPSVTVCTVLNIDQVKVKVAIPEHEIAAISASTPSLISVAAIGESTFKGGAIEKGVTADAITRTYDIKILVPNAGHKLLPGMVANVSLDLGSAASASQITLPIVSVQERSNGQKFVWLVSDGKATRRDVTVGSLQGNRIVITSGLKAGERVITEGYQKVSEGQRVVL